MHGKDEKDLMSADVSARSVSHALGVDRVRALQRVLYRVPSRTGIAVSMPSMTRSPAAECSGGLGARSGANRGAPGVDGVSIDDVVGSGVGEFLEELAGKLRAGSYRPRPLRRVRIPKPGRPGQLRPLGIPCVADRVVMAAARIVLEPIFEADFLPSSYGFRPGRSAHHALEMVRQTVTWRGKAWVLDADIRSCFDEIDHDALLVQIERRVCVGGCSSCCGVGFGRGCSRVGSCPQSRRAPRKARNEQLLISRQMNSAGLCAALA